MGNSNRRTKTLLLAVLATLAALSVVAGSAQAFTKGEFRMGGKTFAEANRKEATAAGEWPLFLLLIPGLKIHIHCTTLHFFHLLFLRGGEWHFIFIALGCTVLESKCTIYNKFNEATEEFEGKETITLSGSGEVGLQGSKHYLRAASESFATIYFSDPGEKCTLPEENALSGSMAFALPSALSEVVEQPIADISKAEENELEVGLSFGAEPMFIEMEEEGSVHVTGANEGKTWGAQ